MTGIRSWSGFSTGLASVRHDGRRFQRMLQRRAALRAFPAFPQSGKGEGLAVAPPDAEGLFLAALGHPMLLPFIEAIYQDQTTPPGEGAAEGRFFRNRLRPRIDHPAAN